MSKEKGCKKKKIAALSRLTEMTQATSITHNGTEVPRLWLLNNNEATYFLLAAVLYLSSYIAISGCDELFLKYGDGLFRHGRSRMVRNSI